MKVVIEYTKEQYGIVEEVLADYINDGWSECREDGSVIAEVDIPGRKITELVQKHINVNNQLSLLKYHIQRIIDRYKAPFSLVVRDYKTIDIMESNDDSFGTITLNPFEDDVYFTHGNTEEKVSIHSRLLPTWIAAYIKGFDEFEKLVSNKGHYTVSMKMEYRVDVEVDASSFEEAFEKATEEVDNIDLSEYVLVASEPINAERGDGTLAEYNLRPYAD